MLLLQRRNALAQFVHEIVKMTDCVLEAILEPINSIIQAFIDAFMGAFIGAFRMRCRSVWHEWLYPFPGTPVLVLVLVLVRTSLGSV